MAKAIDIIQHFSPSEVTEEDLVPLYMFLEHNFFGLLSQNQLEALVSLVYSIGIEEFISSDISKYLSQGKHVLVASEFLKYNKKGRVVSVHKAQQRKYEQDIYKGISNDRINISGSRRTAIGS